MVLIFKSTSKDQNPPKRATRFIITANTEEALDWWERKLHEWVPQIFDEARWQTIRSEVIDSSMG